MLTYISVKNLTVIESASLEFGEGLNVITGETGAGKSVLVGALKFLTGDRFNKAALRDPSQKLSVEGIFTGAGHLPIELKEQFDIDDEIILSRESDEAGKNKVFINGKIAPVTKLREIADYLIDIHGQHEHQVLFDPAKHLGFVDFFVDTKIQDAFLSSYKLYHEKADELNALKKQIEETSKLREMYDFQCVEIDDMQINEETDSKIDESVEFLSHLEKIREATAQCMDILKEGEVSALELVGKAGKSLANIFKLAPELSKASESLNSAEGYINDAVAYIESVFENQNSSPDELNKLIDRKYKLANIFKKYGADVHEVIKYREDIGEKLNNMNFGSEKLDKLVKESLALEKEALSKSIILNEARKKVSEDICKKVEHILGELELPHSKFKINFIETGKLDSSGGVTAEFFISTNAGFEPAPLAMVASGGEVSRVMLALKEVFADADNISTLLFDEIDTGISGKAAKSVGVKLHNLGKNKQIIVITHLPVVAALGVTHFHITKGEKDGLSRTDIQKVDETSRQNVIAMMIAGEITPAALHQAQELIKGDLH